MTLWYAVAPGQFPAYSFRARSAREARAMYRRFTGARRCPKGLQVWPG